ncbi:hypothetical protein [Tabrizicola oligotrophica]|uniref:Uncharacterized protein n=1 Tax=Tabrizicola oligotrophica TaxID=2710650 RepID=A0A6M0QRQ3_9RHOB|nr:hypothetical protein [Tabrizicola oligotrophica]NEY90165.1 hypothetical protein [Tabrizicola oligotrophica]
MAKTIHSPTLAETALGLKSESPLARMMAGFTGFAVAVTLILATVLPVEAHRNVCAKPVDAVAACVAE